jgi:hypothetical protein
MSRFCLLTLHPPPPRPPPPPNPLLPLLPICPPQLFIDTMPLGAHTVAMDCLAIGTPLLAVAGTLYAHRVSSSILAAAGALDATCSSPCSSPCACRIKLPRCTERGRCVRSPLSPPLPPTPPSPPLPRHCVAS